MAFSKFHYCLLAFEFYLCSSNVPTPLLETPVHIGDVETNTFLTLDKTAHMTKDPAVAIISGSAQEYTITFRDKQLCHLEDEKAGVCDTNVVARNFNIKKYEDGSYALKSTKRGWFWIQWCLTRNGTEIEFSRCTGNREGQKWAIYPPIGKSLQPNREKESPYACDSVGPCEYLERRKKEKMGSGCCVLHGEFADENDPCRYMNQRTLKI